MTPSRALGRTHGSCVAFGDRGVLMLGRSGAGKSALALRMIGLGAMLVADDQVELFPRDNDVYARPPEALQGLIEARNVGLLRSAFVPEVRIRLVIDLDTAETERLPQRRVIKLGAREVDLILGAGTPNLAIAARLYVTEGRQY